MRGLTRAKTFKKYIPTTGPRVSVHYIVPAGTLSKQRMSWKSLLSSAPVVIAMVLGVGMGSLIVWQTKFGGATDSQEVVTDADASGDNLPWVKLLEYDQSELDVIATILPDLVQENRHEPTVEEIQNQQRKEKLKQYFQSRKSPFADSDETLQAFLDSKNMKLMIAISFVESTMGKKCYYHNCSGIGGTPPNLRKYNSYADWVRDFDNLIEKRYKDLSIKDFIGLYVQPGSPNWTYGVKQILRELKELGIE